MAHNKSNCELFAFLSDFAYDIKDRITEYEYMQLMDHLKVLFDKIKENEYNGDEELEEQPIIVNIPQLNVILPDNICNCVRGRYEWCTNDYLSFQLCRNYNSFIEQIPIVTYAFNYINLTDADNQIIEPLPHLYLEGTGYDIEPSEENKSKFLKYIKCCLNLIGIVNTNRKYRTLVALAIFDYCIRNIYYPIINEKYLQALINKVNEFIINEIVIFEWISNLFNIERNILYVYKDIFERLYLQNQLTSL